MINNKCYNSNKFHNLKDYIDYQLPKSNYNYLLNCIIILNTKRNIKIFSIFMGLFLNFNLN